MWINPLDHKLVGECLAETRKKYHLTQSELAKTLKKPQSFVSAYESGQRRIDILELLLIAKAIGADPMKIFENILSSVSE